MLNIHSLVKIVSPHLAAALLMSALCAASFAQGSAQPVVSVISGSGWVSATPVSPSVSQNNYIPVFSGRGWYVDLQFGNDANPGTIDQPWKTFLPTKTLLLAAGDALLLKCGQVWRDTLLLTSANAPGGNVLVGGYGDCTGDRRPVIRASDWVAPTDWSKAGLASQAIYVKPYAKPVGRLFLDSQPLIKARFPNFKRVGEEYSLTAQSPVRSRTTFQVTPTDLILLGGQDIVGSTVYLKVTQWETQKATVQDFDTATGVVTLDRVMPFNIQPGSGYILEGKPWMLDAPAEYFYDEVGKQLWLWSPTGVSPALLTGLEASWRKEGLVAKWFPGLRVERVAVEQQDTDGVVLIETSGAVISDVRSRHAQELGISVLSAPNVTVQDSIVQSAGRSGITTREAVTARVVRNRVTDTGGNARAWATDAGIAVFGQGALVEFNLIERGALHGIRFANRPDTVVRNNTVLSSCLRFTDCAGIYTYTGGAASAMPTSYVPATLVEANTVIGVKSNTEGCGYSCTNMALGIYMDELTSGVTILNNTVSDTEVGIGLLNSNFNRVVGNTVRGNEVASFRGTKTRGETTIMRGNQVTGNSFFSHRDMTMPAGGVPTDAVPVSAQFWFHPSKPADLFTGIDPNVVSGNQNVSVLKPGEVIWSFVTWSSKSFLKQAEWKNYAPTDRQVNPTAYRRYLINAEANLLSNGAFNPAVSGGWSAYFNPQGSGGSFSNNTFPLCGKNCGKLVAGFTGDYLASNRFSINGDAGQNLYLYKQTSYGGLGGGVRRAFVRLADAPYTNLGLNIPSVSLADGQSTSDEVFFRATASSIGAVVDLRGVVQGETYYADVSLERIRSIELLNLSRFMSHVINPTFQPLTFPCSALAVSTCDLITETGTRVVFPLLIPARSSVLVFANAPAWRQ